MAGLFEGRCPGRGNTTEDLMSDDRVCGAWTEQWFGSQPRGYTCWKPPDGHTWHKATTYSYPQTDDEGMTFYMYGFLYEPYYWNAPVPVWHQTDGATRWYT